VRTLIVLWVTLPTGFFGWLAFRDWLRQRRIELAHTEALREDLVWTRIRKWQRANERFMKDLGLKVATPRVQPCVFQSGLPRGSVCGYAVRARSVEEAAEIVSQSKVFVRGAA
jgi:hypothetical protein